MLASHYGYYSTSLADHRSWNALSPGKVHSGNSSLRQPDTTGSRSSSNAPFRPQLSLRKQELLSEPPSSGKSTPPTDMHRARRTPYIAGERTATSQANEGQDHQPLPPRAANHPAIGVASSFQLTPGKPRGDREVSFCDQPSVPHPAPPAFIPAAVSNAGDSPQQTTVAPPLQQPIACAAIDRHTQGTSHVTATPQSPLAFSGSVEPQPKVSSALVQL